MNRIIHCSSYGSVLLSAAYIIFVFVTRVLFDIFWIFVLWESFRIVRAVQFLNYKCDVNQDYKTIHNLEQFGILVNNWFFCVFPNIF